MNCIFFGHRDTDSRGVEEKLRSVIRAAISRGLNSFYVGNNGGFDFLVQRVLKEVAEKNKDVEYRIVLSRIDEMAIGGEQEATVFPEGLEKALPRFAISRRNDWLIKKADMLIAYVTHRFSNSSKLLSRAEKKGIEVINLAE